MRKIISFLFTCVIALCALVGCGGEDEGSSLIGYYQCLKVELDGDIITGEDIVSNVVIYDSRNFRINSGWNDSLNTIYKVSENTITFEEPHALQGDIPAPIDGTINGNQISINFADGSVCLFEKVYGKYNLDLVTLNGEDMFSTYAYFYIELSQSPKSFAKDTKEKLTIVYKKTTGTEVREEYQFDINNGKSLRVLYEDGSGELVGTDFTFISNIIKIDFETPNGRIQAHFIKKVHY